MKALKITGLSLLVMLLLILALISYVTMTHGGMQRLFSLGASYVQGDLHWNDLQGSLVGPAEINGLQYDADDDAAVSIDNIKFDWSPRRLLQRQINVEYLSAEGIEVRLPEPAATIDSDNKEPFQLKDLRLPVGAEIKQLLLSDIKVYTYGSDVPLVIDRVVFGGSGQQSDLQVVELSASVPNGVIKVDGVVNTAGRWPMSFTTVWQYEDKHLGPLEGRAVASGNLDELNVNHQLAGAVKSTADIKINDVTGELMLSAAAIVNADDLGVLSPAAEGMPLALEANLSGGLNDLNIDANVTSEHEVIGPFTVDIRAHTDQRVVSLGQLDLAFDHSAAVISSSGDVDLETRQADLDLRWSGLAWPLLQGGVLQDGRLKERGPQEGLLRDGQALERQVQEPQSQDLQSAPLLIKNSSGKLNVQASVDVVTVTGDGIVDQDQAGLLDIALDVAADPEQVLINSLTLGGADSDTSLDVAGVFSITDNRIDLRGDWENLRWPLTGNTADYESRAGQFSVVGPLSEYRLELSLEAGGAKVPDGKWQINGIGSESAFSELQIRGDTLDGKLDASGTAGWTPQPEWDFDINARGINPDSQWPGFDASVDVAIKSSGIVAAEGLSQSTDIVDIGGTYKGQPLDGAGGVAVVDGELVVDNLSLSAGAANITASGTVGDKVNLQWQVEAPSLEALVPGFKGELQINGDHSGSAGTMGSQIEIQSARIDSEFLTVSDLDGTAIVDLSGGKNSQIEVRASGITLNGQQWDSLSIDGNGTPDSHDIDVQLSGTTGQFKLRGDGAYTDTRWNGMVTDLSALATDLGDWTLEQPVSVVAGNEVRFSDLCLRSDASSVCTDVDRTADGTVAAEAVLKDFDISRLREFLPSDIGIDIDVNGRVKLNIDKQGALSVVANGGFPGGTLRYQDLGAPVQQDLGQSSFSASINGNTVDAEADVDLGKLGFIRFGAEITEPGNSDLTKVNGTFDSEIKDLSIIGIFVPELESVTGVFASNIAFNGSINTPRITGRAGIDGLSLEVPSVALEVTDGSLQVSGNGRGGLLFRGAVQSGEGQLGLDGDYNASTGALNLGVAGQNFLVSNTTRQRVAVSPDLNIRFADRQLSVSGDLLVPTALVKTGGGTTVIVESPDVVIVDSSVVPAEKKQSEIDLDVQVTLGDDIRIDAGQFDGALSGGLRVNKKPGQVITGSGAIEVISGDFLVYGQKLTMESGKILFSGGPIDDPVLDLDVARDVAEFSVKAGVRVTGTAQTPILELQSDPPQTDANTLSFILLGKPIEALGASYTLGRFITPDLYVSFGFDLFDRREIFTLRYQLLDRLSLIGSSSRSREPSSGADLIYTLER